MADALTIVAIYYDQPLTLARQIACWSCYSRLKDRPQIVLVDDGSPTFPAATVLKKIPCDVPVRLFRIEQDIAWNMSGARNLGCGHAAGWMIPIDMDSFLYPDDVGKLQELADPGKVYQPCRLAMPYDRPRGESLVSLLFHRTLFDAVGGYDEDYAGGYGFEEFDFLERLQRVATLERVDAAIRLMPAWMSGDASTQQLDRSPYRNHGIFKRKRAAGFFKPDPGLRFKWQEIVIGAAAVLP